MKIGRITRFRRETAAFLALDLSSEAIKLMGRTPAGDWEELGAAPLDGDFAQGIDALRVEALVRGRGPVPVDLWLPADQVIIRRYALPLGAQRRDEARRRLAAETGLRPEELAVAVAPTPPHETATVLAVPSLTVAEAREYATRWGFRPGRASTRVCAAEFGGAGPSFDPLGGGAGRALGAVGVAGAAAGMAAALALAAVLWQAGEPQAAQQAVLSATSPALSLSLARADAGAPDLPQTQLSRHGVPPAADPQARTEGRGQAAMDAAILPGIGTAPELARPPQAAGPDVAPTHALPRHLRPARLTAGSTGARPHVLRDLAAAGRAAPEGATIVLAARETAPGAEKGALGRAAGPAATIPGEAAALLVAGRAADGAVAPVVGAAATGSGDRPMPAALAQGGAADTDVAAATRADGDGAALGQGKAATADATILAAARRPDGSGAALPASGAAFEDRPVLTAAAQGGTGERDLRSGKAETEDGAMLAGLVQGGAGDRNGAFILAALAPALLPVPLDGVTLAADNAGEPPIQLAAATVAPRSVPGAPPPRPRPQAAPEAEPGAQAEPASPLAAGDAPRPPRRPAARASRQVAPALRAVSAEPSPAKVTTAATGRGLQLDGTSLIGVLEAKIGKRALIRTAGGAFMKVARGESVDGWRVSAIDRDAVRLTKGAQSRTLLLISR